MAPRIGFEWRTGEEEFLRFGATTNVEAPLSTPDRERWITLVLLRSVTALLVMAAATASAAFSPAQQQRIQVEQELAAILVMEQQAWAASDPNQYKALVDPQVTESWIGQWRGGWGTSRTAFGGRRLLLLSAQPLSQDFVRADVQVMQPRINWWQASVQRETRFYRRAGYTWLRTLPPAEYWGNQLTLETPRLSLRYHAPDAQAVTAAAVQLEAAYLELHAMLGVEPPSAAKKIVVIVQPELVQTRSWAGGDIELTSPLLAQVDASQSDADYVASTVLNRIIAHTLNGERIMNAAQLQNWGLFLSALRGWLRAELLGLPTPWRGEAQKVFVTHAAGSYPLRLADLTEFQVEGQPGRNTALWRYMAAETLLEYSVARAGQEALPALLDGLSETASWPELIGVVFDASEEEFVAGWNRYLAEAYDLQ